MGARASLPANLVLFASPCDSDASLALAQSAICLPFGRAARLASSLRRVSFCEAGRAPHRGRRVAMDTHLAELYQVPNGMLWWRLARDLKAKRAVVRYLKRKVSATSQLDAGGLATLPCCEDYCLLQASLEQTARCLSHGSRELESSACARAEELKQLSVEVSALRRRVSHETREGLLTISDDTKVCERIVNLPPAQGELVCASETCVQGGFATERVGQVDVVQEQLVMKQREVDMMHQQLLLVDRQVAEHRARLNAYQQYAKEAFRIRAVVSPSAEVGAPKEDTDDQELLDRCIDLHGPARRFLRKCGPQELSPLPRTGEREPAVHVRWVQVLVASLTQVCEQLCVDNIAGTTDRQ